MRIPETQLCAWVETPGPDAKIDFRQIPVQSPGAGQVLVKLEATGVCHSDHHSIYGNTPMTAHVAGHEGVGRVVAVGDKVPGDLMNTRVGVSWLHSTCGACEICKVDYTHCPKQDNSGRNVPGTFQQYCLADASFVTRIPDTIPAHLAAPLLCGGIAVYCALKKAKLHPGDFVVFPGAGGGLGHLGVQIASSLGYEVIAIDSSDKEDICKASGAKHFLDFRQINTKPGSTMVDSVRSLTGDIGAHAVLCITGAPSAYDDAVKMLRNCGTLVCVGIPPSEYRLKISPFEMLVRGLTVVGSTVGSKKQMKELMDLCVQGKVKPEVREFAFDQIEEVLGMLGEGKIAGRAVLRMPE